MKIGKKIVLGWRAARVDVCSPFFSQGRVGFIEEGIVGGRACGYHSGCLGRNPQK